MKDLDNVFEMKGNHMFKSYRIEEHVLFLIIFCLWVLLKLHIYDKYRICANPYKLKIC